MAKLLTAADGRQLAADMMRELAECWRVDDEHLEADDSRITETLLSRDPAIMRPYLARATGDLEAGMPPAFDAGCYLALREGFEIGALCHLPIGSLARICALTA